MSGIVGIGVESFRCSAGRGREDFRSVLSDCGLLCEKLRRECALVRISGIAGVGVESLLRRRGAVILVLVLRWGTGDLALGVLLLGRGLAALGLRSE